MEVEPFSQTSWILFLTQSSNVDCFDENKKHNDEKNVFQVQFDGVRLVQAIATQGRADVLYLQFVTKYRVMHSTDCVHFVTYRTSNGADMV